MAMPRRVVEEGYDRSTASVLVLDDDEQSREHLNQMLEDAGFAAVFANPFSDADLDAFFGLVAHEIHLVIACPLSEAAKATRSLNALRSRYGGPIILVCRHDARKDLQRANNVYACLERGQSPDDLILVTAEKALLEKHYVQALEEHNRRSQKLFVNILAVLVRILESKDPYTRNHSHNVCKYARMLGRRWGLKEEELDRLGLAAMLHDFGKIGIVEAILNKASRLSNEEYEIMKQHASIGGALLESLPDVSDLVPAIVHHHERWDGNGYPDGLKGEECHLWARIIAVADAYDTMASRRTYKEPFTREDCLKELRDKSGTQFDPDLARTFIEVLESQDR